MSDPPADLFLIASKQRLSSITPIQTPNYCSFQLLAHTVYAHEISENVQSFLLPEIGGKKPLNCLAFALQLVRKLFGFHFGNFFTAMQKMTK